MQTEFIHKISKGSRFNQIYIPQKATNFEAGDIVKVILLEKKQELYYSKNLSKLNEFKENLIRQIFSFSSKFKEIKQMFVFGSFLTKKTEYNDIDILIIYKDTAKKIDERISSLLINKFEINFHIIAIPEDNFNRLEKTCPLTRSMLYYFVSSKKHTLPPKTEIDKNHLKFLLMMPQDILNINVESKVFYDSTRRIITIQRFLENKSLNPLEISQELENSISPSLLFQVKSNQPIDKSSLKNIRKIIKNKLNKIKEIIK